MSRPLKHQAESQRAQLPGKKGKTLAYRYLCLHPKLSSAAKAVGAVLVDRFNRVTGQCDPGISTIGRDAHLHRASVFRAIGELVKDGIVWRIPHGGKSHRNSYSIDWQRAQRSQSCDGKGRNLATVKGRNPATQTIEGTIEEEPPRGSPGKRPIGRQTQRHLLLPFDGGRCTTSRSSAAREAAHGRWESEVRQQLGTAYGDAVEAISQALADAATEHELRQPGQGAELVLSAIGWHDSPPVIRRQAS